MTTTTETTASVRDSLARLHEWLTAHPEIPVASVEYLDDGCIELILPTDVGIDVLRAAADAADALSDVVIKVEDPQSGAYTDVIVLGDLAGEGVSSLDLRLDLRLDWSAHKEVREGLLASLGAAADPADRCWQVTAEHLRSLAETASAAAGA